MRLSDSQQSAILNAAENVLGKPALVTLFGSRANDLLKGGDIDLLFETDSVLANKAHVICSLYAELQKSLGDRKIDILVKDANTPDERIYRVAKSTGVRL